MADWAVLVANGFLASSLATLIAAPIAACSPLSSRTAAAALGAVTIAWVAVLSFAWRKTGVASAAVAGPVACLIGSVFLWHVGRVLRALIGDTLSAAMAGASIGALLTLGAFAAGPLTSDWPAALINVALISNPLITTASAAQIDFLHIDTIYRTSPLAHRGLALPAWTTACVVYAVVGLAAYGASRIRPRSLRT